MVEQIIKKISRYIYTNIWMIEGFYYDRKLDIETTRRYPVNNNGYSNNDASPYEAIPYRRLKKIADYLKCELDYEDVFIDFGSGKGRVVFFMAAQRIKKVVGVEFNSELINIAKNNLNNLIRKSNIRINTKIEFLNIEASLFDVREGTIFFLFNPFGQRTLMKVIENIRKSLFVNPRKVSIIYYNPIHRYLLDREDWLVLEKEVCNDRCLIWKNRSAI